MVSKRVIGLICTIISVSFLASGCLVKKTPPKDDVIASEEVIVKPKPILVKKNEIRYDLYSTTPYEIPLISILDISKLSGNLKKRIDNLLIASQGFYYLKSINDKIFIILQNPVLVADTYSRHNLQFAVLDSDGNITFHSAGYNGIDGEILNTEAQNADIWDFDESIEPVRPIKHIAYDENGNIKFSEYWNYNEAEPIKYQMKDSHNRLVSILKEIQDSETNYRKEHIFYDNEGNIKMSLVINYDNANISRLNFYNSHDLIESVSIINEYQDGFKVKELIYDENYALRNTVKAEYSEGERKTIKLYDSEEKEIYKIFS